VNPEKQRNQREMAAKILEDNLAALGGLCRHTAQEVHGFNGWA
jgi:hypothetical protein